MLGKRMPCYLILLRYRRACLLIPKSIWNKTGNVVGWFGLMLTNLPPMTASYLETLNREQRRAVEHGVQTKNGAPGTALLVIAGAGSGKTNTVAHRVAHHIVNGTDPRRVLLMTFSRRAAAEMIRRVEHIARQVMGGSAGAIVDALTWAGTFHGIGARLLREYADQIGIDPAFTIQDREDSADLVNLVRHELGFSRTEARFPTKGTCLAIYSRCINAELAIEEVLDTTFPWCSAWAAELKELFAAYVEAKQLQRPPRKSVRIPLRRPSRAGSTYYDATVRPTGPALVWT